MRSGSELRARRRVPWPLGTLVLFKGILCLAMLPTGGHATATFACPWLGCPLCHPPDGSLVSDSQEHRYPWQGCWQALVLTQVGVLHVILMSSQLALLAQVFRGHPACKCGMALVAWACSVPSSSTQHLVQQAWGPARLWDKEGPVHLGFPSHAMQLGSLRENLGPR